MLLVHHVAKEWLEHELVGPILGGQFHQDERFMLILGMVRSMNTVFREFYSRGAWLRMHEAEFAAHLGMRALNCYHQLASVSATMAEPRFPVHPKFHMLWHIFHTLQAGVQRGLCWHENPLLDSCQQDEGMVGVLSRYSRRVSPKQTIWRTLDLYQSSLWQRWHGEKA